MLADSTPNAIYLKLLSMNLIKKIHLCYSTYTYIEYTAIILVITTTTHYS